jgi:hypothetical protein
MKTNCIDYERLNQLREECPELTYDNNGYEYISTEVKEKYAEQIKEISEIILRHDPMFTKFNNFKPRKTNYEYNGEFAIRYQRYYGEIASGFQGVHYEHLDWFKIEPTIEENK